MNKTNIDYKKIYNDVLSEKNLLEIKNNMLVKEIEELKNNITIKKINTNEFNLKKILQI